MTPRKPLHRHKLCSLVITERLSGPLGGEGASAADEECMVFSEGPSSTVSGSPTARE